MSPLPTLHQARSQLHRLAHRRVLLKPCITTTTTTTTTTSTHQFHHPTSPPLRCSNRTTTHHLPTTHPRHRPLSTTPPNHNPPPSIAPHTYQPTPLTPPQYHALADTYINNLLSHLEALQETRADIDVEYSAGVLTLVFPPSGTYVLNKQPPNKQIWLSSPVSGPKRYDWVTREGGKGGGGGEWVYLRDGSTLGELLEGEVGVRVGDAGGDGDGGE